MNGLMTSQFPYFVETPRLPRTKVNQAATRSPSQKTPVSDWHAGGHPLRRKNSPMAVRSHRVAELMTSSYGGWTSTVSEPGTQSAPCEIWKKW